jgi:hypothetical protein
VPTDTTDYSSLTGVSAGSFVISKATPTLSVGNSPVTYSGSAQSATVNGSVAGAVSGVLYNGSATVPTAAGTYTITANLTPTDTTDYSSLTGASAGSFVISKATFDGDGDGHDELHLHGNGAGAEHLDGDGIGRVGDLQLCRARAARSTRPVPLRRRRPGTYTRDGDGGGGFSNCNGASSSATAFTIGKAAPVVTVTAGSYTYSGTAQGPSAVTFSPAGDTGTVTWSYAGTGGYDLWSGQPRQTDGSGDIHRDGVGDGGRQQQRGFIECDSIFNRQGCLDGGGDRDDELHLHGIGAGAEDLDGDGFERGGDLQLCGHGQHDLRAEQHPADGSRQLQRDGDGGGGSELQRGVVECDSLYDWQGYAKCDGDGGQLHLQRIVAGTKCGDVQPCWLPRRWR